MRLRLVTLTFAVLTAAIPLSTASASEYKEYCVVTTTPTGPQPPTVCVVDPTP